MHLPLMSIQACNGSDYAAQSVSRTIKIKKPSKSVFEEKQMSATRSQNRCPCQNHSKLGVTGEKALALFNSTRTWRDGYPISERAWDFWAMTRGHPPSRSKAKWWQGIPHLHQYNSTYQNDMVLQYIVERSTDLRTWLPVGSNLWFCHRPRWRDGASGLSNHCSDIFWKYSA